MTSICEVEHGPPGCVGVWFRDLEEGLLVTRCIRIWQSELVYWSVDAGVGDRPFQIARCFTANCLVGMAIGVTAFGRSSGTSGAGGRNHLGDAKVTLRRRSEKVGLLVVVGVNVGVEGVVWLTIWRDDEGWEMIRNGRMVGRGVDGVDCRHDGGRLDVSAAAKVARDWPFMGGRK